MQTYFYLTICGKNYQAFYQLPIINFIKTKATIIFLTFMDSL